jgi:hypothetical protein
MDARELASADEKHRQQAADRFGSQETYHSEQELFLCADRPPDVRARDGCWLNKDYACLAKLALAASEATRMRD